MNDIYSRDNTHIGFISVSNINIKKQKRRRKHPPTHIGLGCCSPSQNGKQLGRVNEIYLIELHYENYTKMHLFSLCISISEYYIYKKIVSRE